MAMENAEEIFHFLEDFSKCKPKTIPQELNDYLAYVARTGDPVFQWSLVKCLFKEKLLNVITDFNETSPGIDIPPYPNVDPFNYDTLKNSLIERLESFTSAPFTVQRICELLTCPRKQYNRVDKYMRAIEKNILVVSTREPGIHRHAEAENGEPIVNGSDNNSEYNVDVEMEDMSWKEAKEQPPSTEPQPSSSESYSIAEIEARLHTKQGFPPAETEKSADTIPSSQQNEESVSKVEEHEKTSDYTPEAIPSTSDSQKVDTPNEADKTEKMDTDMKIEPDEPVAQTMTIPEIKINDTSMEDKSDTETVKDDLKIEEQVSDDKCLDEKQETIEGNIESKDKEMEKESKLIAEVSEASSSSEESSSSSDNTDGNSNSPKAVTDEQMDDKESSKVEVENPEPTAEPVSEVPEKSPPPTVMQSDNYSITDVNSELPQIPANDESKSQESVENKTEAPSADEGKDTEEQKTEINTKEKVDTNDTTTTV